MDKKSSAVATTISVIIVILLIIIMILVIKGRSPNATQYAAGDQPIMPTDVVPAASTTGTISTNTSTSVAN